MPRPATPIRAPARSAARRCGWACRRSWSRAWWRCWRGTAATARPASPSRATRSPTDPRFEKRLSARRRPVVEQLGERLECGRRIAVSGFEMNAQRIALVDDTVDDPLVQIDHQLALLGRFGAGQRLDERLLIGHRGVAGILDEPVDEADPALQLRYEAERQQDLRPMVRVLGELGQAAHDGVGVQQLGLSERRTLVALEVEPALFTLPGGNQNHSPVVHQLAVDRQGVGRRDTGALAVSHGAGYADEHDAVDAGADQITEPLTQGLL